MSDDYNGPWYSYKAYITIPDLSRETIIQTLCHDERQELVEKAHVEIRLGQTTQAVIQYHRDNTPGEGDIHPKLFLVVDSGDFQNRGVLLVSLDEYHGYNDALRYPIEEGRDSLNSLCVGNDDWFTFREGSRQPTKWFSLYNLLPEDQEEGFREALQKMNEGLQMVGVNQDEDDDIEARWVTDDEEGSEGSIGSPIRDALGGEGEGDGDEASLGEGVPGEDEEEVQPDEEGWDQIYKAAYAENRDLDQIMDGHALYAQENRRDPSLFAVIDKEYETEGLLIARVTPERDSFRCKGEVAGEFLRWIFINLMTWDEAKSFASSLS
ncbi:hypothetical protein DL765_001571 [Monosporascus sp. GIB2]|nr:hypothetical protein DL765_001571 [Monosporascus sp. GIB2]